MGGSGNESAERLLSASIDPSRRGETLGIADFVRLLQRSGKVDEDAPQRANRLRRLLDDWSFSA